jgi:diguanylate cyclase (GGDEF)-like protein/PAS domain S-box-containing protein
MGDRVGTALGDDFQGRLEQRDAPCRTPGAGRTGGRGSRARAGAPNGHDPEWYKRTDSEALKVFRPNAETIAMPGADPSAVSDLAMAQRSGRVLAAQPEPELAVRVLLVEDDEDDYLITRDMLEAFGDAFELDWRRSYAEALAEINLQRHDIYLIDYRLGHRTGLQLMREAFAGRPTAPAIMLTGEATPELDLEARALGVTDFLVKQELNPADLERSIRYAISHQRAERHAMAAQAANDGIWDWDLESGRIYLSPRWHAILGLPAEAREVTPDDWLELVAPEDRERLRDTLNAHVAGHTSHLEFEHRMRHADGGWRWVMTRGLLSRGVDGAPARIAGAMTDMTVQRTTQLRLEHEALHDGLTGLPNRALFMDRAAHLLDQQRRDPERCCAVLFMDLDGFKAVNDNHSHAIGDRLLVSVAERLRAALRPGDTVARLGGDEFTMLLHRIADVNEAVDIAERVLATVRDPFPIDGNRLLVGASVGIAVSQETPDAASLVGNADAAMYEAKGRGRGQVAVFDETMRRRVADRLAHQNELRRIVAEQRIEVHFQPIVELAGGRLIALEALARWPQDRPAPITPTELIALADQTGLIVELGHQVLSKALRALAGWRDAAAIDDDVCVTVNLSAHQLEDPQLVEHIRSELACVGLPASALRLEISERTMMGLERSPRGIELAELGVALHVDDFGTGYTSLLALHRLPVRALKVDRSFVSTVAEGGESEMLVRSAIAIAHTLGLPAIAEGIESAETLERLRALGCDCGQGQLIAAPVTRADVPLDGLRPALALD